MRHPNCQSRGGASGIRSRWSVSLTGSHRVRERHARRPTMERVRAQPGHWDLEAFLSEKVRSRDSRGSRHDNGAPRRASNGRRDAHAVDRPRTVTHPRQPFPQLTTEGVHRCSLQGIRRLFYRGRGVVALITILVNFVLIVDTNARTPWSLRGLNTHLGRYDVLPLSVSLSLSLSLSFLLASIRSYPPRCSASSRPKTLRETANARLALDEGEGAPEGAWLSAHCAAPRVATPRCVASRRLRVSDVASRVALPVPLSVDDRCDDSRWHDSRERAYLSLSLSLSLFLSARTPSRLDWQRGHVDLPPSLSLSGQKVIPPSPSLQLPPLSLFLSQGTWLSVSLPLSLRVSRTLVTCWRLAALPSCGDEGANEANEANFRSRIDVLSVMLTSTSRREPAFLASDSFESRRIYPSLRDLCRGGGLIAPAWNRSCANRAAFPSSRRPRLFFPCTMARNSRAHFLLKVASRIMIVSGSRGVAGIFTSILFKFGDFFKTPLEISVDI